jgi:hypothetical protein
VRAREKLVGGSGSDLGILERAEGDMGTGFEKLGFVLSNFEV